MKKTYFFKRADGTVFACEEEEASQAQKKFAYLGVSDGQMYEKVLREEQEAMRGLKLEVVEIERKIELIRSKLDELFLDDADAKTTKRLTKKMEVLLDEWSEKKAELNDAFAIIDKKAFDAELKIAKKNKELPPDMSVYYPNGNENVLRPYMSRIRP